MPLTTSFANYLARLIFLNENIPNIGDSVGLRGASAAGNFWLTLHTASPGVAGTAPTNEVSYTGYARLSLVRGGAAWVVSGNVVNPISDQSFPANSGGTTQTATHFGIVNSASGAGMLIMFGTLSPSQVIAPLAIPRIKAASALTIN